MAIGTAAAIGLGVAGIGAGASALASNSASKRAAETSENNNTQNTELAREIYGNNQQVLNPFVQRGNAAGDQLNAMLGLGGGQQAQPNALSQFQGSPAATPYNSAGTVGLPYGIGDTFGLGTYGGGQNNGVWSNYLSANPDVANGYVTTADRSVFSTPEQYGQWHFNNYGQAEGRASPFATQGAGNAAPNALTPQQSAEDAFSTFRDSTGYQFRRDEGLDAVTSAYAGIGGLQSGAAMRGINDYATGQADNTFGQYAGLLSGQQAVGAGAASSLAGVGQNFAGTVINSNNLNAANQMNAQLGQQNVFGNVLGTIGGGILGMGG